jgi:hypothetical protein
MPPRVTWPVRRAPCGKFEIHRGVGVRGHFEDLRKLASHRYIGDHLHAAGLNAAVVVCASLVDRDIAVHSGDITTAPNLDADALHVFWTQPGYHATDAMTRSQRQHDCVEALIRCERDLALSDAVGRLAEQSIAPWVQLSERELAGSGRTASHAEAFVETREPRGSGDRRCAIRRGEPAGNGAAAGNAPRNHVRASAGYLISARVSSAQNTAST